MILDTDIDLTTQGIRVLAAASAPLLAASAAETSYFSTEALAVLSAFAQIFATCLSFAGALILAWITIIAANRTSCYAALTNAARDISAALASMGRRYRAFHAQEAALLQFYREKHPDLPYDELVESAFYELHRQSNGVQGEVDASKLLNTWYGARCSYEEMMLKLLASAANELDKFEEDRSSGHVNLNEEWRQIRAYRKELFPNGTVAALNWLRTYERFEKLAGVCVLRKQDFVEKACASESARTDFPPTFDRAATYLWLEHIGEIRAALSPLSNGLRAVLNDQKNGTTLLVRHALNACGSYFFWPSYLELVFRPCCRYWCIRFRTGRRWRYA